MRRASKPRRAVRSENSNGLRRLATRVGEGPSKLQVCIFATSVGLTSSRLNYVTEYSNDGCSATPKLLSFNRPATAVVTPTWKLDRRLRRSKLADLDIPLKASPAPAFPGSSGLDAGKT